MQYFLFIYCSNDTHKETRSNQNQLIDFYFYTMDIVLPHTNLMNTSSSLLSILAFSLTLLLDQTKAFASLVFVSPTIVTVPYR